MKLIFFFIFLVKITVGQEIFEENTTEGSEGNETLLAENEKNDTSFISFFENFETEKIQIQLRRVIKSFDEYRAEIALGAAVFIATILAVTMVISGFYFNRLKKSKKSLKDKKKRMLSFPKDTDMEVNAVLSIYRAKKIEIQAVNNGKASTHRFDEGTDDDEVIYEYAGNSKIIDFHVVNPVYFVDGGYEVKLEEKQKN